MEFAAIPLAALAAYVAACIAIAIVPGPTVTVIIANSLRGGMRTGLANVAGTQVGLALMLAVLALGLETIVSALGEVFTWVKLAGAAYLVWLGVKLWRARGATAPVGVTSVDAELRARDPLAKYFWQGFLVVWANPKALLFFGAFIPQFVNPAYNAAVQTVELGLIFMAVATVLDSGYAVLAGKAGSLLTRDRVRLVERISGTCLIGGGLWLAFTRRT